MLCAVMIFIGNPLLWGSMAISNLWFFVRKWNKSEEETNTWIRLQMLATLFLPLITIKKTISAYNSCWNQAEWLKRKERALEWLRKKESKRVRLSRSSSSNSKPTFALTHKTHTIIQSHTDRIVYNFRNGRLYCDCLSNLMFKWTSKNETIQSSSIQRRNKILNQMLCIFCRVC